MKKIFTLSAVIVLAICANAQLAYDHEFDSNDFNNGSTVFYKSENVSWSNGVLGAGKGLTIGKYVFDLLGTADDVTDEIIIALPQIGLPDSISFTYVQGSIAGSTTITLYESSNNSTWSGIWTASDASLTSTKSVKRPLSSSTRYLKFSTNGKASIRLNDIIVTEKKALSVSLNTLTFGEAMVDDPSVTLTTTVQWTNIVTSVTSSDEHFVVTPASIGEKNRENQTTQLYVTYTHTEAGFHNGTITIAGEGKSVSIAVSGATKKYDQTLSWTQSLGTILTTDELILTAFTTAALDIVYESSNTSIAEVNEQGRVIIHRSGTINLTATQPGNYKYNSANTITKQLTIIKANPTIALHCDNLVYGQSLAQANLTETLGKVPGSVTWADAEPSTILDAGEYTLNVRFLPADTGIYNERQLPVLLIVEQCPQTITWDEDNLTVFVDSSLTLNAISSSPLPVEFAFTACKVIINGTELTALEEGEVYIVAFQNGNNNYLPAAAVVKTVNILTNPNTPTQAPLTQAEMKKAQKKLINGQLRLIYNNQIYTVDGQSVKR